MRDGKTFQAQLELPQQPLPHVDKTATRADLAKKYVPFQLKNEYVPSKLQLCWHEYEKRCPFFALSEMFWTILIIAVLPSIESIFIFQGGHLLFKAHAGALRYQLLLNSTPVTWTDLWDRYPWINCTKVNRDRIDTKYLMSFFLGCNCKT